MQPSRQAGRQRRVACSRSQSVTVRAYAYMCMYVAGAWCNTALDMRMFAYFFGGVSTRGQATRADHVFFFGPKFASERTHDTCHSRLWEQS